MTRHAFVADWLTDRFSECPVWPARELDALARHNGIDLVLWWPNPAVQALGIVKECRDGIWYWSRETKPP